MKRTFYSFNVTCWFYLLCLALMATNTLPIPIYAEVGANIILPCGHGTETNVLWKKNNEMIIKKTAQMTVFPWKNNFKDASIHLKLAHISLQIIMVQMEDSGLYTCESSNVAKPVHVHLIVFEVSAEPSPVLLMSENLILTLKSSMELNRLQVSWNLPLSVKNIPTKAKSMEITNVQIAHSGKYTCHITIDGGEELSYTKDIQVKGFYRAHETVYKSGSSVILPWEFNFGVRTTPLLGQVVVTSGGLYYSLEKGKQLHKLSNLNVTSGVRWPRIYSTGSKTDRDLSVYLRKPHGGWYRMELTLQLDGRNKTLFWDTCVAELKVSFSNDEPITMNSQVTLLCNASCMPVNGIMRWHNNDSRTGASGERGQTNLAWTLIVLPETVGTWTCSLFTEEHRKLSADLILEEEITFEGVLLWVGVGVAVLLLLAAVLITSIAVARCRRRRRARYRAWLIQTLHQQNICECQGFSPSRLRERCAD